MRCVRRRSDALRGLCTFGPGSECPFDRARRRALKRSPRLCRGAIGEDQDGGREGARNNQCGGRLRGRVVHSHLRSHGRAVGYVCQRAYARAEYRINVQSRVTGLHPRAVPMGVTQRRAIAESRMQSSEAPAVVEPSPEAAMPFAQREADAYPRADGSSTLRSVSRACAPFVRTSV